MADFIRDTLADLRERGLYRRLRAVAPAGGPDPDADRRDAGARFGTAGPRVRIDGREVLLFASNNYLDLADDPRVADALRRGLERWGWGAGASRLLAGHTDAHAALEADLAAWLGAEAALVFPSGYTTNLGAVTALAGRSDTVVMDRACHASLYDAVAMSRARLVRYPPCDAAAATEALAAPFREKHGGSPRTLLVTDAVFSMDGRRAPLADLMAAAEAHGAALLLDEAHALGVLGDTGAGLAEEVLAEKDNAPRGHPERAKRAEESRRAKNVPDVFLRVGTLSKALGGVGGFVAASREVIDLLVNRARPFIYTTALPPAACEATREALRILRAEPQRRTRLHALSRHLRTRLREEGFDLGPAGAAGASEADADRPPTPIVPVILGDPDRALAAAAALLARGIFCPAVRPPTVPAGTSRLRISLTAGHTEENLDRLVAALVAARDVP